MKEPDRDLRPWTDLLGDLVRVIAKGDLKGGSLGLLGEFLASKALVDEGYNVSLLTTEARKKFGYGTLLARRKKTVYVIEVKTRKKFQKDGKVNTRYRLSDSKNRKQLIRAADAATDHFGGRAYWVAVPIDEESYSVVLGSLLSLEGKSGIPMAEKNLAGYRAEGQYLVDGASIVAAVSETYSNKYDMETDEWKWDVFISHASEDKEGVARPLAESLKERGLRVWFDAFVLQVGQRLTQALDEGLKNSKYGVVVISPSFIVKKWTKWELEGFMMLQEDDEPRILPVRHDLTAKEVLRWSPLVGGMLSASTSRRKKLVDDLMAAIQI